MKSVHRRRAIEAEDDDDEEGFEQQLQKKMAAQRVAAAGKRPRSLAADTPADDDEDDDDDDAVFHDEYVYSVQDDPGLYKDVADYNRMQALSEFDREMELAERMDMRQKNMDQWERRREIAMEKRRAQRAAAEASAKKAKGAARAASRAGEAAAAAAAEADAAPSIPDARQQLLAEMKEAREKRQAQIEEGDGPKGRRRKAAAADDAAQAEPRRPPVAAAAEEEEAEEGAVEDDEPARATKARERAGRRSRLEEAGAAAGAEGGVEALGSLEPGDEPAPYEQLERIRLTRNRLESWIEEPFFEETVVGCFVRVSIGQDSGEPIYRVAEVVGVTEGSLPYTLSGGKAQTKKRLLLEIAGSRRAFHVTFVSNSDFGVDELRKYRRLLEERLLPRRTVRQIEAKVAQLLRAKHYVYNEQARAHCCKLPGAGLRRQGRVAVSRSVGGSVEGGEATSCAHKPLLLSAAPLLAGRVCDGSEEPRAEESRWPLRAAPRRAARAEGGGGRARAGGGRAGRRGCGRDRAARWLARAARRHCAGGAARTRLDGRAALRVRWLDQRDQPAQPQARAAGGRLVRQPQGGGDRRREQPVRAARDAPVHVLAQERACKEGGR